jgi:hypothetical protein
MEKKHRKMIKGELYPPIPLKPVPKGREKASDSFYYIAVVMLVGVLLCLVLGALDYVSQDITPITTDRVEYFE